jgi:hypothetical protein
MADALAAAAAPLEETLLRRIDQAESLQAQLKALTELRDTAALWRCETTSSGTTRLTLPTAGDEEEEDDYLGATTSTTRTLVVYLLQRLVLVDRQASELVQQILAACPPLLVWQVALDTLRQLQPPSNVIKTGVSTSNGVTLSVTALSTTLQCLVRLVAPAVDEHEHDEPFVLAGLRQQSDVSLTTTGVQQQQQQEMELWVQSVLRLPLVVANLCESLKVGLPRAWRPTSAAGARDFYGRMYHRGLRYWLALAYSGSSTTVQQHEEGSARSLVQDYLRILTLHLIRHRGATDSVVVVWESVYNSEGQPSALDAKNSQSVLDFLQLDLARGNQLSPRELALVWQSCVRCSLANMRNTGKDWDYATADETSWGLASGQALLVFSTAQEAVIQRFLFGSSAATTSRSELQCLVRVLLAMEDVVKDSENDDELEDEGGAGHGVTDTPTSWTNGQRVLSQHVRYVARLWSTRTYVRQTDPVQQAVVGLFLEQALAHLTGLDPASPILLGLIDGVTARLESLLPAVRQSGMRVAEALAHTMGQDLAFDELRQVEESPPSLETQAVSKEETSASLEASPGDLQKHSRIRRRRRKLQSLDADALYVSDSDESNDESSGDASTDTEEDSVWENGDEELLPYDLEDDEEDLRETPRPVYLRECLELLRTPESGDHAFSNHEAALQELPALVRSRPLDLVDLARSLAMQLLRMENKFNMESFEDRVSSSLVALVVEQPIGVGETLILELFGEGSLADRLNVLGALNEGAYELSGFMDQTDRQSKLLATEHMMDPASRVSGRRRLVPDKIPASDGSATLSQRTRRWGTRKSAGIKIVNKFTGVAPTWFYALLGNFIERRQDAVLWGGAVGSALLSKLLFSLTVVVELSGRGRMTEIMAKELFELVWGFRQAEVPEVRIAALCSVASAITNMHSNDLLHILYDNRADSLSFSLRQIVSSDPDQECRDMATKISQTVAQALEASGTSLMPAS